MKSFFIFFLFLFLPGDLLSQEVYEDYKATYRSRVVEIVSQEERNIPGTDASSVFQTIKAEILNGDRKGDIVTIENDYLELEIGDTFYFNYLVDVNGVERFGILNIDRRGSLSFLLFIFIGAVIVFGGKQGLRALIGLLGSFLAIFYILIPGLLSGWNPIFLSALVSGGVLFLAIFFTHGFNRESLVAYVGTMCAVFLTSIFALYAVSSTDLSGFGSDESVYLNFNTKGSLDFVSLLLGGIIIGVLGVLDDIAVTQAAVVSELYNTNRSLTKKEAYTRALRVGREHVSALVNTLILAYTGTALPLLLYFSTTSSTFSAVVNMELVATEIVRAIVGSLGLILTVPIVTGIAVHYLRGYSPRKEHHFHTHVGH